MAVTPGLQGSSEPVFLRALEPDDAVLTHRWRHDAALWNDLGSPFRYFSLEGERQWLEARRSHPTDVTLVICLQEGAPIGYAALRDIDPVARRAELHLLIGEAGYRGQGFGSAAVRLLVRHAFDDLGLQRLYLFVLARNSAAARVYEKAGFALEGRLRSHVFKSGIFEDVLVMGLVHTP